MKRPSTTPKSAAKTAASPRALLDFAVAVIELYFRLEAATQTITGFAHAGGEYGVLRTLVEFGPHTVPDMARARPISRQHCQTIVNGLHAQGLVTFEPNPRHKRSPLVTVSKKGRARFAAMTDRFLAAEALYTPHFTNAEIAVATDVARRARERIVA